MCQPETLSALSATLILLLSRRHRYTYEESKIRTKTRSTLSLFLANLLKILLSDSYRLLNSSARRIIKAFPFISLSFFICVRITRNIVGLAPLRVKLTVRDTFIYCTNYFSEYFHHCLFFKYTHECSSCRIDIHLIH